MTVTAPVPYLQETVTDALRYADANGIEVPLSLRLRARQVTVTRAVKAGGLGSINAQYNDAITATLISYFEGGSLGASRNAFKRAMVEAFGGAFDAGWVDGGQELPFDGDALEWFNARVEQEAAFIDSTYVSAKQIKKDAEADFFQWTTDRATGYVSTLSAIYNAAKMWANKNRSGIWRLGNTEKHCATCSKLNGTSHRLSWYIANNYIPRQPGASMDCGGYNCDCKIEDKKTGEELTL